MHRFHFDGIFLYIKLHKHCVKKAGFTCQLHSDAVKSPCANGYFSQNITLHRVWMLCRRYLAVSDGRIRQQPLPSDATAHAMAHIGDKLCGVFGDGYFLRFV